jgi:hypothetical protein
MSTEFVVMVKVAAQDQIDLVTPSYLAHVVISS